MNKIWLIVKREYWTRVRKKSFLFLTLLAPLGLALLMVIPFLLTNIESDTKTVLLKDESGIFKDLRDTTGVDFSITSLDYTADSLITLFSDLGFDAFLYIPETSIDQIEGVQLWSVSQISVPTQYMIESALEEYVATLNLEKLGLKRNDIKIRPNINLQTSLTGTQNNKESSAIIATAIGYGMGFLIYMVLLIYGTMVMKGVMEEKTNRIVEVIITSVKPFQLMLGKIIGIGAVGLTQFSLWIILAGITQAIIAFIFAEQFAEIAAASQETSTGALAMSEISGKDFKLAKAYELFNGLPFFRLIFVFIFYFFGGYLLYSALFAAVGSLVNDDGGDVQMYTFPVMLPIIVSIILMMVVIQQPHSSLAFWASIFPLTSPIVMPARVPFLNGFSWELILSMILLVVGFISTTWFAGRVYRTGILLYGKKPSPKEIWKWLWY